MFTGLVEEIGILRSSQIRDGGRVLTIEAEVVMEDLSIGDSIAVQGVCQTVVERGQGWFRVVAVEETLRKTTLGMLGEGEPVNLERALLPTKRLGGHIVQGHVETVGRIVSLEPVGTSRELWVTTPPEFQRYLVPLGSIALDGISLTIARTDGELFMVAIIPHTWEQTTLQYRRSGDSVNLEFDILAKYVEQLIRWRSEQQANIPR
ncbi:MAG: riboflavin synthase subunit alpha [Candidatus Kapaibacterium sp.]|nr:MAG: riboflavin synthase subunit alpha [Candidatus Kapabacteria bacterium]